MNKTAISVMATAVLGLSSIQAMADPVFNPTAGAEVINRENKTILNDYNIEKNYVKPVQEGKIEKSQVPEKDVKKGNLTYNPQFLLNKVIFEGNTKISDKKLQKLAEDLIGKQVYLEDVMMLTVKVSRYYQEQGYLTSYAYLDAQEIKDGVVVIQIHESKVSNKEVSGNRWERDAYMTKIALGGAGLNEGSVFNAKALQGAMKDINKQAYLQGAVELYKTENNNTGIKLNVKDRFPMSLDLGWDDYGRNYTGRQRFSAIAGMDNLTGFGDKLYGGAIVSSRSNGVLAGYEIPVSKWGTRLGVDYSYSRVHLGGPYKGMNIDGMAEDFVVKLVQPLKNTARQEINLTVALDMLNSESMVQKTSLSDYRLRVIRSAVSGMFDDKYGRILASFGVDAGLTAMGATGNISGGQQSSFYKIIASLARVQRLPKDCLLISRINGQYSPQVLYAAEQMYLGGAYSLRGYQPSEILGDYGVAGSFEIRTPVPYLNAVLPKKLEPYSNRAKLLFFYDWGYVKDNLNMYDYPQHFLCSVGLGTYINVTDALSVQFGVGFPITSKRNYDEESGRLYFAVNSEVDKWLFKPREKKENL